MTTLISQLAEIRSQLETSEYEYEQPTVQQPTVQKSTDWLPRSGRLRRQIGGLLENCGCPAGPPGPAGPKGRKGKKGKNGLPGM